jgi:CDP-glucose 4,6-dehydratase
VKNEKIHEIRHQHLSAEKARKILGWKAKYSIEKGLEETVKWYRKYFKEGKGRLN